MKIFLGSSPLWALAHPRGDDSTEKLRKKLKDHSRRGDEIAVAEICDYETRRELLRRRATKQLQWLDDLIKISVYPPIDSQLMREAATLWSQERRKGRPTSSTDDIDIDVILAAEARRHPSHIVVTRNLRHFSQLCNAVDMKAFARA